MSTILSALMQSHSLSQEELGAIIGVSRPSIAKMLRGDKELTLGEARQLSEALGITLDEVVHGTPAREVVLESEKPRKEMMEERIILPAENVEKFKQALLYITQKIGALPNVGQTVLYKILYFCDFDYYEKFEEQLIGAKYIKNHYGPTPVAFRKIVDDMVNKGQIEEVKTKYFKHEQVKYLPVEKPKLNLFSVQEIQHIDEVLNRLGDKSATELSNLSHKDVPWISTPEGKEIPYESVFYRTPETSVRNYEDADL